MNIPRKLHQIWYQGSANISDNGKICQNTVKKINNDWDYILWDEAAINNLVEKDYAWFKPYFNQDTNMIQKIDLAKYLILHKYGGIYVDMDFIAMENFNKLLEKIVTEDLNSVYECQYPNIILTEEYPLSSQFPKTYSNAIMISSENHPFWLTLFNYFINNKNYNNKDSDQIVYKRTGPDFLFNVVKRNIKYFNDILILTHEYLCPCTSLTNDKQICVFNGENTLDKFCQTIPFGGGWQSPIIHNDLQYTLKHIDQLYPNSYCMHLNLGEWKNKK